jgi:hypothetical protein
MLVLMCSKELSFLSQLVRKSQAQDQFQLDIPHFSKHTSFYNEGLKALHASHESKVALKEDCTKAY